jgi:hypothetical protein
MNRVHEMAMRLPWWAWPAIGVTGAGLLIVYGSDLVAGLVFVAALVFALAVTGFLLWMLVGLAQGRRHPGVDGFPAAARHAGAALVGLAARVRGVVGFAPWRRPAHLLTVGAGLVGDQVAQLPSGSATYPTVTVAASPTTIERLDRWMPIDEVAWQWARAYADTNVDVTRSSDAVTVLVITDSEVPQGRFRVEGSFRAPEDGRGVALARCTLRGPAADPQRRRELHTVMRIQRDVVDVEQGEPVLARDGATRLEPGRTVPMGGGSARGARSAATTLMPEASTAGVQLIPADPTTGQATGQQPLRVSDDRVIVGRSSRCGIRLAQRQVSREHAVLERGQEGWSLEDRGSTGGTFVDGRKLPVGLAVPLPTGALVEFGRTSPDGPAAFLIG